MQIYSRLGARRNKNSYKRKRCRTGCKFISYETSSFSYTGFQRRLCVWKKKKNLLFSYKKTREGHMYVLYKKHIYFMQRESQHGVFYCIYRSSYNAPTINCGVKKYFSGTEGCRHVGMVSVPTEMCMSKGRFNYYTVGLSLGFNCAIYVTTNFARYIFPSQYTKRVDIDHTMLKNEIKKSRGHLKGLSNRIELSSSILQLSSITLSPWFPLKYFFLSLL